MVSIIILSYNTQELLRSCLASITRNLTKVDYEIIVVDNASSDGSVSMIKKDFREVTIIENRENVGFARGINIGAKQAKGKYLLFLNSDAEVLDNRIEMLIAEFQQHEKTAVIGGMLLNPNGTMQRSYGKFYTLSHILLMLIVGDKGELLSQKAEKGSTDWVSGGFMMIRSDVFNEISGFDERFFMYVEDMELCYRVKKLRYAVWFMPEVQVRHVGHGSSNRTFAIIHIYKGILYFYLKHKSIFSYTIVKSLLQLKAIVAIGIGKLTNNTYLTKTYREALAVTRGTI